MICKEKLNTKSCDRERSRKKERRRVRHERAKNVTIFVDMWTREFNRGS